MSWEELPDRCRTPFHNLPPRGYSVNMVDKFRPDREQELNLALEAMYFGFRSLIAHPDARLAELGYSRVHHRILYFIGRNPGIRIGELLAVMGVSKQYLHRPLARLVEDGRVRSEPDPADRRARRLSLTPEGAALEQELSGDQRRRFARVFARAGPEAEAGWRRVMELLARSEES